MILLEVGNLNGLFIMIGGVMFGPPILFAIIGLFYLKNNKKAAKVCFILSVVYLLVSLGICGSMMAGY